MLESGARALAVPRAAALYHCANLVGKGKRASQLAKAKPRKVQRFSCVREVVGKAPRYCRRYGRMIWLSRQRAYLLDFSLRRIWWIIRFEPGVSFLIDLTKAGVLGANAEPCFKAAFCQIVRCTKIHLSLPVGLRFSGSDPCLQVTRPRNLMLSSFRVQLSWDMWKLNPRFATGGMATE